MILWGWTWQRLMKKMKIAFMKISGSDSRHVQWRCAFEVKEEQGGKHCISLIVSDMGNEFLGEVKAFAYQEFIKLQQSTPEIHKENGVAERAV